MRIVSTLFWIYTLYWNADINEYSYIIPYIEMQILCFIKFSEQIKEN